MTKLRAMNDIMRDLSKIQSESCNQQKLLPIVLFCVFIDFVRFSISWPVFARLIFDPSFPLLDSETSMTVRGCCLGLLLALPPFFKFFSSAVWGTLSDNWGRKKTLQMSLFFTCVGTLCAVCGIYFYNLWIILCAKIIVGLASANSAIAHAAVADLSIPEEKMKNFGLFSMMIGLGYSIGPLLGGTFAGMNYTLPFIVAAALALINSLLISIFFKETLHESLHSKINWKLGWQNLKKAFLFKELQWIFSTYFWANFARIFFVNFLPVYLIKKYQFSSGDLGAFFSVASISYALSSGLFIRPLAKYLNPETLLFGGLLSAGTFILSLCFISSLEWMWFVIIAMFFCFAYVSPSCNTLISNHISSKVQGEILGVSGSVYGLAAIISPLVSGAFVGTFPMLPIWGGGSIMVCAACIYWFHLKARISLTQVN